LRRFDSILVSGFQVTFNLTQNINYIVIKKGKKLDEITSLSSKFITFILSVAWREYSKFSLQSAFVRFHLQIESGHYACDLITYIL